MDTLFFPKSELPVSVCSHRYGADMTYTEQSDSFTHGLPRESTRDTMEYYAHKYGARLGCFIQPDNVEMYNSVRDMRDTEKYGIIKFDTYFRGYQWYNPTKGVIEWIPDFSKTSWTQDGITAFGYEEDGVIKINGVEVSVGSPKSSGHPRHGEEMYAYSNGKYGWDENGNMGQSDGIEFFNVLDNHVNLFYELFHRYSSAASYGYGISSIAPQMIEKYLQCRDSGKTDPSQGLVALTWYGKDVNNNYLGYPQQDVTKALLRSRASSTRWWDSIDSDACTKAEMMTYLTQLAALTASNHGWQNNFTHWQGCNDTEKTDIKIEAYDDYWTALFAGFGNSNVHFCSYGEATEYMVFRNNIQKVAAFEKDRNVYVAVKVLEKYGELPSRRIYTPLSVIIDLTGTALVGKNIMATSGKVANLGNNRVLVEVPYPYADNNGVSAVKLYEVESSNYFSLDRPIISNVLRSGDTVTFNTDIPCYSEVFEITNANEIWRYGNRYIDELKTSHEVKIGSNNSKSYSIGVISEIGKTNLYNI